MRSPTLWSAHCPYLSSLSHHSYPHSLRSSHAVLLASLECSRHTAAPGPLHFLSPPTRVGQAWSPAPFRAQLASSHEAVFSHSPHTHSPLRVIFLPSTYHHHAHCVIYLCILFPVSPPPGKCNPPEGRGFACFVHYSFSSAESSACPKEVLGKHALNE